jgi:transcriptional regulator with XRE-family HTH domain
VRLGRVLKSIRSQLGKQQKDVAHQAGLTANYLSLVENGKKRISADQLDVVAETLGLRGSHLYALAENPEAASDPDAQKLLQAIQSLIMAFIQQLATRTAGVFDSPRSSQ